MSVKSEVVELLDEITLIASRAAAAILAVARGDLNRRDKADSSPVTAADDAAEQIIRRSLETMAPDIPVISEETTGNRLVEGLGRRFFLVDPLDGTREFISGLEEYTVNIALIEDSTPLLGVVAAPAHGKIWRGHVGRGAERLTLPPGRGLQEARERIELHVQPCPAEGARVLISRSYPDPVTDAYINGLPGAKKIVYGSSLKFCVLAEGLADLYPRLGPISEWDIAAGHAVLVAAGGQMQRPNGEPVCYGQPEFRVKGFIARGATPQR